MSRGAHHFRRDAETGAPDVFIPSGCAALVRRSVFFEAGGFDQGFFCYSEDTDLFIKIRLLGWKCAFAGGAVVYHAAGGGTMGVISPEKTYLVERNRISILVRFFPLRSIVMSPVYTAVRYVGLLPAVAGTRPAGDGLKSPERPGSKTRGMMLAGRIKGLLGLLRAYKDGFSRIPGDLRVRREWRRRSRIPLGIMRVWLKKYRLDLKSLFELEPQ
jgi:GT2 family glycosyltransferase